MCPEVLLEARLHILNAELDILVHGLDKCAHSLLRCRFVVCVSVNPEGNSVLAVAQANFIAKPSYHRVSIHFPEVIHMPRENESSTRVSTKRVDGSKSTGGTQSPHHGILQNFHGGFGPPLEL